jgi:nucleoside-diphosphate-sugar epimerase
MKLLITGADNALGECAVRHFSKEHEVRTVGRDVDLRDPVVVASLVEGVGAVLHLDGYGADVTLDEFTLLDRSARGTYVLMHAARDAGVGRVVVVSTLDMFEDYPGDYVIDETWRPLPKPDAASFVPMMVELTAREFAREGGIEAVCLRFGALDASGTPEADAMKAIEEALKLKFNRHGYRWGLFHVHSDGNRFASMMLTNPLRMQEQQAE